MSSGPGCGLEGMTTTRDGTIGGPETGSVDAGGVPVHWEALVPGTLLVHADGDSIPVTHAAEFFGLLGGGLRDVDRTGAGRSRHRLAVRPGRTHHDLLDAPALPGLVREFTA